MKKELQYYREENELLVSKTSQLDECRRQIEEVTRQNDFLESQLTELCEAPFLKSSAEEDHERERDGLKVSIRETQSAYESLVSECNELREQNGILHSRLNFSEGHKAAWGNSVIENTAPPPSESVEKVLNQLDDLQKQHYQTERDLEQSNQLLSAQITINEALQGQIEDSECVMNKKINTLELKSQDLSFKATKRLQRIRLLESKMKVGTTVSQKADGDKGIAHSCLGREDNILEIKVASASLSGERLSDSMVTFVALDFHTFDTQFSNTATGTSPTWNFVASFEMEVDQFLLQTLANQCVRIEVYTLQSEATPRLFAHASVSMFDLLNENTSTSVSRLELFPIEGETQVGHLSVSLNLAQPLPNPLKSQHVRVGLQSSDTERTEYKCENMWQRQCIKPDVIHIMIDSVTLSIDQRSERERVYFVHYRFMSFGEEITSLVSCDSNGVIHLQHKAEFPILSTIDGRIEPVLLALSKGFIRFTLFSSSKRIVENDESQQFMVVGEVQVPLSNAFQSKNEGKIKMDMVSLEAKVVASISGTVDTTIKSMPSGINDDFKQLAHFRLMASLCEAFFFLATGSQSSTSKSTQFIKSERLLRFLCPPVGIFDTAQCLQRQISTNFPGKSMRDIFLLPPKQKLSQSEFRRCANNAQSIAMPMPQNDELMDLFQYLSTDEGFVITSDLAFFVESQALETLISTCQALHRRNVFVRQDIREKGTQSSLLTFQSVEEYFESIINGMDEVELSCVLPPSVMQPSEKKTDIN